jgi:hypothetical protein
LASALFSGAHVDERIARVHVTSTVWLAAGDLVLSGRVGKPLAPDALIERIRAAWKAADLNPILLHECRHTYAAFMIA